MKIKDILHPEESADQDPEAYHHHLTVRVARSVLIKTNPEIQGKRWQNIFGDNFARIFDDRIPLFGRIQASRLDTIWDDAYLATIEEAIKEQPELQTLFNKELTKNQPHPAPQEAVLATS